MPCSGCPGLSRRARQRTRTGPAVGQVVPAGGREEVLFLLFVARPSSLARFGDEVQINSEGLRMRICCLTCGVVSTVTTHERPHLRAEPNNPLHVFMYACMYVCIAR